MIRKFIFLFFFLENKNISQLFYKTDTYIAMVGSTVLKLFFYIFGDITKMMRLTGTEIVHFPYHQRWIFITYQIMAC